MVRQIFRAAWVVALPLVVPQSVRGQEVSYSSISGIIEVETVAVAFSPPRAQLLLQSRLATPENILLLANVKTICVLPYDGWQAKTVIDALPSLSVIRSGLETNKTIRQQRNEVADELSKKGFQPVDCLAGAEPDGQLLFTKVLGGGASDNLPAYFWLLYASAQHQIKVYGESELLGLARPASGSLPFFGVPLAEQVWSVVDAARVARSGTGMKRVDTLADVEKICISGSQEVQTEAIAASKAVGVEMTECGPSTQDYDAELQVSDLRFPLGTWLFVLTPRGGASDLYRNDAKSIQAGMKDLSKALRKANRR